MPSFDDPKPIPIRPFIGLQWKLLLFALALIASIGCENSTTETAEVDDFAKAAPDPLKILVVGEPSIGPKLKRQWNSRMGGELTVVDETESNWIDGGFLIDTDIDLVVYPTTFIGELAESKKVLEVDYSIWSSDEVDKESYLNHYSRSVIRYGNRPMAVPLGNPHFAMLYDQTGISEEETKTERRGELPETWLELEQWLEQNDTKVEYPLAKGWAGHTLLGRVAPNARAVGSFSVLFDRTTMKPQISSPPFVEALEKIKQFATKSSLVVGPGETFQAVLNGKAVAALGWPAKPNENSSEAETGDGDERGSFAIGAVPGATRVFDFRRNEWKKRAANDDQRADLMGVSGLVVSIVAANQHEYSAIEFLKWVSDDKIILSVATDSPKTGPVRVSHLGNIGRWIGDGVSPELADEYATVVREIHQRNLVVLFPRIPGSNRYYSALDQGVRAVITGDQNPQQALKKVAEEWEEITGSIGREKQIQAMRRESGF